MNTTEQQRLQAKIDELQAELDALKEPEVDWSKMAGRLVMVRDGEDIDWGGPFVYSEYSRLGPSYPHVMNHGEFYGFAKPYTGPTRPNWIEWRGGEQPVDDDTYVLCQLRSGYIHGKAARDFLYWDHDHGDDGDIMRYTIIEP